MTKEMETIEREILHFIKRRNGPVETLEIKFGLERPFALINEGIDHMICEGYVEVTGNRQQYLSLLPKEEFCLV